LLESDNVLPEQAQRPIRRRLNSARGHSLVSNPHLGRSLRDLDSHWWGQQIAQATDALQDLHASAKPLVPLFETLEITPAGEYRINLIDPAQSEHVVQVVSSDHRLLRIRNYLSEQFSVLGTRATPQMVEAGAVHTLNTGFTIQALMNVLRGREGDDRTLTTAVRLHAYVNYAQLVHGNVTDVAGLLSLIKTALNEEKSSPVPVRQWWARRWDMSPTKASARCWAWPMSVSTSINWRRQTTRSSARSSALSWPSMPPVWR
jgi:insecticidal toxin